MFDIHNKFIKISLYFFLSITLPIYSTEPLQDHNSHLYFGYGSNLSHAFLCERLKDGEWHSDGWHKSGKIIDSPPIDLGTYILEDYEFGYTLDLETETAGNVAPKEGARVYGALYRITEKQLEELDRNEDVPIDYRRVALKVNKLATFSQNQALAETTAWVYVGNLDRLTEDVNPHAQYVQLLVQAALERGFPQEYIENYLIIENLIAK